MEKILEMKKIITFLEKNGYKEDSDACSEYRAFNKSNASSVDINNREIVLVGERGDWLHLPLNYYALVGALIHHRQLACDYKQ